MKYRIYFRKEWLAFWLMLMGVIFPVLVLADSDSGYEQTLDETVQVLQEVREEREEFVVYGILNPPKGMDRYAFENRVLQSIEHKDFDRLKELLRTHQFVVNTQNSFLAGVYLHPYQVKNSAFHTVNAIFDKNHEALKAVIDSDDGSLNESVFSGEVFGETPLKVAIQQSDNEAVRQLLEAGVDVNATGASNKNSPAMVAFLLENDAVLEMLIDNGVDGNTRLRFPFSSLTILAKMASLGNEALVQKLLDNGADPDMVDIWGWTPLMEAVHGQHAGTVKLLLPVSNPLVVSSRAITEAAVEKQFDRQYPICNALYVAEQIEGSVGQEILALLQARVEELGDSPEKHLLQLEAHFGEFQAARNRGDVASAEQAIDAGLAILENYDITPESDGDLALYAINLLLHKHENALITGVDFSAEHRAEAERLWSIGSHTKKSHDMLDLMALAVKEAPEPHFNAWKKEHGAPNRRDWSTELFLDWIEVQMDVESQNRLFNALDFFVLN